jgi:hypothetical protein
MLVPENGSTSAHSCAVFGFGVGVGVGVGVGFGLPDGDGLGLGVGVADAVAAGLDGAGLLGAGLLGEGLVDAAGLGESLASALGLALGVAAGLPAALIRTLASLASVVTCPFFALIALAVVAGRVAHTFAALASVAARCVWVAAELGEPVVTMNPTAMMPNAAVCPRRNVIDTLSARCGPLRGLRSSGPFSFTIRMPGGPIPTCHHSTPPGAAKPWP